MTTAAYSEDGIISDFDERQPAVRKRVLKNSKKAIFLFEKSKLGKKQTYTLAKDEDTTEVFLLENYN